MWMKIIIYLNLPILHYYLTIQIAILGIGQNENANGLAIVFYFFIFIGNHGYWHLVVGLRLVEEHTGRGFVTKNPGSHPSGN